MSEQTLELPAPPTDEVAQEAARRYARDVAHHYGSRLSGIYMFGSRARGDHGPESDVDIAIVLKGPFSFWTEFRALADMTYEYLVDDGVELQPHPLSAADWADPTLHENPSLVKAMKRDGRPLL